MAGFICHIVVMIAKYLELPLRFPIRLMGSRCTIRVGQILISQALGNNNARMKSRRVCRKKSASKRYVHSF